MKRLFCCVLLLGSFAAAKDAPSWETGTLISQTDDRACGVHGNGGSVSTTCTLYSYYRVDAGSMIYTFRHDRSWVWQKRFLLTVNGEVHFAFRNGQAYLQDEQGKPRKVYLYEKELNTSRMEKR